MYKFLILSLCFVLSVPCIGFILDGNSLKKIYHISDAQNVEIVERFSGYEDVSAYGACPNCLDISDLKTLNSTFNWNDLQSFGINNKKDLYVAKINNAFISPTHLGTIFDNGQQLLFDIVISPGYPIFWPVSADIRNYSVQRYRKIATVQGPTFFYHWVIDRLPSVLLMRDLLVSDPEMKLIVNTHGAAGYVYEYLDLLGIKENKIIRAQRDTVYYADSVYFATPFLMEPIPKELLSALRNELLQAAKQRRMNREYKNNLIVIIQRSGANRQIGNLEEVIKAIRSFYSEQDYEIVIFDSNKYSVSEQIVLFNNAKVVIGIMASGLTNVLYTNPDTVTIEIHPTLPFVSDAHGVNNAGNEWVWWLSSAVGCNYWALPVPFKLSDAIINCPIQDLCEILKKYNQ